VINRNHPSIMSFIPFISFFSALGATISNELVVPRRASHDCFCRAKAKGATRLSSCPFGLFGLISRPRTPGDGLRRIG
jgi:hypothetical protein